jgi:hypothetical protein
MLRFASCRLGSCRFLSQCALFSSVSLFGCSLEPLTDDAGTTSEAAGDSTSASNGGMGGASTGGTSSGGASNGGAGVGGDELVARCDPFAHDVIDVVYGPGAGFGQSAMPGIVLGPPRGGGALTGSLDVVSLGNGGAITLGFGDVSIVDGEGADFIVFENAFFAGGNESEPFAELGTVAVSEDGATWFSFPCTASSAPFGACAGHAPVFANVDVNDIDPTDPAVAGGNAFDLADVGLSEARFVRITDRADLGGFSGTFDLDAIAVVHAECALEEAGP